MTRHTVVRAAHDLGLYAFFGGSLMGATSLNAAASQLDDPAERARVSTRGWSRWAPVSAAALATHLAGGAGLLVTDRARVKHQRGVGRSTAVKTAVTAATVGASAWSAVLNRKMAAAGAVPVASATDPSAATPPDVARTQKQLKVVQWLDPALGGALVVLTSLHSEQQRPAQVLEGTLRRAGSRLASPAPLAVAGLATAGLLARRKKSGSRDTALAPAVTSAPTPVSTSSSTSSTTSSSPSTSPLGASTPGGSPTVTLQSGPPVGSYAPPPSGTTTTDGLGGGIAR